MTHFLFEGMAMYYAHWEHQVFTAVLAAVHRGLSHLSNLLDLKLPSEGPHGSNLVPAPLLKVGFWSLSKSSVQQSYLHCYCPVAAFGL